jgi:PAS domain S-box-containing protein
MSADTTSPPASPDPRAPEDAATLRRRVAALELERDVLRAALAGTEESLRATFRTSPVPMTLIRVADRTVVDANPAFLRQLRRRREEVVGRTSGQFALWADPAERERFFSALNTRKRIENLEVDLLDGAGARRRHVVSAQATEVGGRAHILVWGIDITHLKELEAALDAARAKIGRASCRERVS